MDRPDLLLSGGPIWTGERMVDAIGVADGIVTAAGSIDEVATTLRPGFTRIDTQGRRAIPGLIDSHIHVLRAGLTWNHVTSWDDVDSLEHGLAAIRLAAEKQPDDSWLRVLGGWHPGTFPERRGPTRAELDEASDGHPAYVQLLYEEGMLNSRGLELLLDAGDVPGVERDDEGAPTGRVAGPIAFGRVAALFEQPSAADREASTRAVMADFNAKGLDLVLLQGLQGFLATFAPSR